jgi:hypothetical protein
VPDCTMCRTCQTVKLVAMGTETIAPGCWKLAWRVSSLVTFVVLAALGREALCAESAAVGEPLGPLVCSVVSASSVADIRHGATVTPRPPGTGECERERSRCGLLPVTLRGPAATNRPLDSKPRVYGTIPNRPAGRLHLGYALALRLLRQNPACGELFGSFGASGSEKLAATLYAAPTHAETSQICNGGVVAFTSIGSMVTRLCPLFGTLHVRSAALTLIHEALHFAGMPESPATPGALTSQEISALVENACGTLGNAPKPELLGACCT